MTCLSQQFLIWIFFLKKFWVRYQLACRKWLFVGLQKEIISSTSWKYRSVWKFYFFEKLLEDGTLSNMRIIWTFKISMNFNFVVRVSFRQDTVYILNYYAEYIFFTMFWFLKTFQFRKYKQFCPEIEWNPDQKNGWDHRFRIFIRKENGFITFISRFTLFQDFTVFLLFSNMSQWYGLSF